MSDLDWRPAGEVLSGVQLTPLDYDPTILEAVVFVKVIDEDGDVYWTRRVTPGVSKTEAIGMLEVERQVLLQAVVKERLDD